MRILVVDDDTDICEYFEDFLTSEGYEVTCIIDPTKAMSEVEAGGYHLALIDLMMPKLSGMDLVEQLRRADDDLAIVIMTGHPTLDTAAASIEHDVSAYLRKPFSTDELRAVLRRIAKKKGLVLRKEEELHLTIGRTIRELRKTHGLTLKQTARRTNLSVSLLSQIERAESSASISSLFKIATALDVPLRDLFGPF